MYQNFFKVILDYFFAILLLPLLLVAFFIVGLAIFFDDKGPILYVSKRLGKNGKVFKIYKFRSMKVNAPDIKNKDGSTYNSSNDARVTKVGKFIRKTSVDEIPQVLNILKNDMSFVGPRPDLPRALNIYNKKESKKLLVKPGITGYNQAYFRNSISQSKKFMNDVFYVENLSFTFDVRIIFKTIISVLKKDNINNEVGEK